MTVGLANPIQLGANHWAVRHLQVGGLLAVNLDGVVHRLLITRIGVDAGDGRVAVHFIADPA